MRNPHIGALLFNTPLAIDAGKLQAIMAGVGHRFYEGMTPDTLRAFGSAAEAMDLGAMTGKENVLTVIDNIAVVNISGSLTNRSTGMDAISGLQSYAEIEEAVMDAATDPHIGGILLDANSPGGESEGLFDLMDVMAEVAKMKPLYAVANESAFSAAYALVAPAEKIFVPRTGGVGSVGVIAVHVDESEAIKGQGLKMTVFRGGKYKAEHNSMEPLSNHATDSLQKEVNRRYDLFVNSVANVRSVSADRLRATEAQTFYGEDAIAVGLADQVGTFKDAFAALEERIRGPQALSTAANKTVRGVTAPNPLKEAKMEKETTANVAPPQDDNAHVIDLEETLNKGRQDERARTKKITSLCQLAGVSGSRTLEILSSDLSVDQVMEKLTKEQSAASDSIEIDSVAPQGATPPSDTSKAEIDTAAIYRRRNKLNAGI